MNPIPIKWSAVGAAFAFFVGSLIPYNEGTRLAVYDDGGGVPTVCNGITGPAIKWGMVLTPEQCAELDSYAAMNAWGTVMKYSKVELTPWEHVAYADLVYNIGETQFRKSTLLKKLNSGDHRGACDQLLRWVYDNGRKLKGLVNRRALAWTICTGAWNDAGHSPNHRKVRYDGL